MNQIPLSSVAVVVDSEHDHVAIAKSPIPAGTIIENLDGQAITIRADIAPGHRFAIRSIRAGEWVRQYGQPFAIVRADHPDLQPGDPVSSDVVASAVPQVDPETIAINPPVLPAWEGSLPEFQGFHRSDGQVGVRNWVLIVPTSMCSSHEAAQIALRAEMGGIYTREKYPNVDGVTAIPHTRGCGCPDMMPHGAQSNSYTSIVEGTMRLLGGYIKNPNVGAVILIELGCEKTNLDIFNRYIGQGQAEAGARVRRIEPVDLSAFYGKPVISMSVQGQGGTKATIQRGLEMLPGLLEQANQTGRSPAPFSKLALGLKCGGSDAFSGLTANPALGVASDMLVRAGGTSIITEVPEFFGAEHLFAQRAVDRDVARQIFGAMERYRKYVSRVGHSMAENPSPGNKEGGLLNITIKSLGALAKAGTAPVQGVLDYGEPYWSRQADGKVQTGLYLMYGPGYDQESVPPLVAGGCQIVCFTTGRGTGIGSAIAPVMKLSSNNTMYERMSDDMDVNAGDILEGHATLTEVGRRIFEEIAAVASGKWVKAEENGHREFTIWSEEGISL